MTTASCVTIYHGTLAANTPDVITITGEYFEVEVLNRGTAEIYFTVDGGVPTVGGAETYVVPGGGALRVVSRVPGAEAVRLISTGTPAYSVTGIPA